jgi:hypothetical protein
MATIRYRRPTTVQSVAEEDTSQALVEASLINTTSKIVQLVRWYINL